MTDIMMIFGQDKVKVNSKADLITCARLLFESFDRNSPTGVFKENIKTAIDTLWELSTLLLEDFVGVKKATSEIVGFKRTLSLMKNAISFLTTKDTILTFQYNSLLSFEGKGLLSGFGGVSKFGDRLDYFNPERHSLLITGSGREYETTNFKNI